MDVARIAGLVVDVMAQLGYERFGAGAATSRRRAPAARACQSERLVGLHLSGTNPDVIATDLHLFFAGR